MKALIVIALLLTGCTDLFDSGSARAYKAVTTGGEHSCAVSEGGEAYCWGRGLDGELGHGVSENHATPVQVTGDIVFEDIAAGWNHTCGLAVDERVFCWGWNAYYQRGNPTDTRHAVPVPVASQLGFRSITAGAHHTCALTADSVAYCWGFNRFGQLGSGNRNTGAVPDIVLGGLKFAGISAGAWHTCGWTSQGVGYCWGNNDQGQLGIGSDVTSVDLPHMIAGAVRFREIDAGETHTCGVATTNALMWCWGSDEHGELGNGSVYLPGLPAAIEPRLISPLGPAGRSVHAGAHHTCSIGFDGLGWCWGRGEFGQLGVGTIADNYIPQRIHLQPDARHRSDLLRFTTIAAGGATHVCGLADRSVYCWGTGASGQLGVRNSRFAVLPQRVGD